KPGEGEGRAGVEPGAASGEIRRVRSAAGASRQRGQSHRGKHQQRAGQRAHCVTTFPGSRYLSAPRLVAECEHLITLQRGSLRRSENTSAGPAPEPGREK